MCGGSLLSRLPGSQAASVCRQDQNTATFRHPHWPFIQTVSPLTHFFRDDTLLFQFSFFYRRSHFLPPSLATFFHILYMRNTTYYGRHGRPHSPLLVHPPFPSFTWVMTAQTSSPTNAYAHGYVQNAHARAQAQTQTQTYPQNHLPASCAAHHGCYQHRPCFAKPLLSPEPAPALESAEASPAALHGTFMVSEKTQPFFCLSRLPE